MSDWVGHRGFLPRWLRWLLGRLSSRRTAMDNGHSASSHEVCATVSWRWRAPVAGAARGAMGRRVQGDALEGDPAPGGGAVAPLMPLSKAMQRLAGGARVGRRSLGCRRVASLESCDLAAYAAWFGC